MRSVKIIPVFFLFAIAFYGCRKEVQDIHPELLGVWNTDINAATWHRIVINKDEKSAYITGIYPQSTTESGNAKIKNDILKIGKAEIHILAYPAYDNAGNYYIMTDEGIYYGVYAVLNCSASVSGNNVTFSWTSVTTPEGCNDQVRIEYKLTTSSTWQSFGAGPSPTTYLMQGLASGSYEWRMKSIRYTEGFKAVNYSGYSPVQTFIVN